MAQEIGDRQDVHQILTIVCGGEKKIITGDAAFHSANSMQEIGRALEYLDMAEGADRHR